MPLDFFFFFSFFFVLTTHIFFLYIGLFIFIESIDLFFFSSWRLKEMEEPEKCSYTKLLQ